MARFVPPAPGGLIPPPPWYLPVTGGTIGVGSNYGNATIQGTVMPVSCTFSGIHIHGTITSGSPTPTTITVKLLKNTVETGMAASITLNTQNATVPRSNTANPFSVVSGDAVVLKVEMDNVAPTVVMSVATVCGD